MVRKYKRSSVLMVGSFPPLIAGECVSNKAVYDHISLNHKVGVVNTCLDVGPAEPGKLSFKKLSRQLVNWMGVFRIPLYHIIYITPGHSYFGFLKTMPFIVLGVFLKRRVILHFHGSLFPSTFLAFSGLEKRFFHFILGRSNQLVVLSHSLKEQYESALGLSNITIVNNFYLNESLPLTISKPPLSEGYNLLFLSNLLPEKGIYESISAVIALVERGFDVHLHICGALPVSEQAKFYDAIEAGKNYITYHGLVTKEKPDILGRCQLFILPTYYPVEGVPLSLIEAMAAGLVPVVTNNGGISDTVGENSTIFVDARSVSSIVDSLIDIMGQPGKIVEMGLMNSELARREYSYEKFTNSIDQVLFG